MQLSTQGKSELEATHPLYDEFSPDWETQRDLYRGERVVKAKGEVYLPATANMHLDGMNSARDIGQIAYEAYKLRALFPDYMKDGVENLVGMLWQKPATFEVPDVMKPLLEKATLLGESMQDLLRRINAEQLITGRIGLLADLPIDPDQKNPMPYISTYIAESIRNWDEGINSDTLTLVVLDESGFVRDNFAWKRFKKYRVLQLSTTAKLEAENADETKTIVGKYLNGAFDDIGGTLSFNEDDLQSPGLRGKTLSKIPFVFINTKDVVPTSDEPPLLGLGKLALAIYRGDADYRQTLFLQGQDTLVVVGGTSNSTGVPGDDEAIRVGAGSRIDVDINGDAKYIGVSAVGLPEQRAALENDHKRAAQKAGQLSQTNSSGGDKESGEALQTRLSAQTATLKQIALTGAKGLENVLRDIAEWLGADRNAVKVTPNLDFKDMTMIGSEVLSLISARTMGAPISLQSIHALMVARNLTKLTYEEEIAIVKEEMLEMPPPGTGEKDDE